MNINNFNAFYPNFTNALDNKTETNPVKNPPKKNDFLSKFETNIINSADLNDTVQVPRTIFKGYLAFMAGSALATLTLVTKGALKIILSVASAGLIVLGTFNFVKPYIIKNAEENKI